MRGLGRLGAARILASLTLAMGPLAGCERGGGDPARSPAVPEASRRDALVGRVTIRRDGWGVPHVLAEDWPSAVFGYAYAQAEDRMRGIARRILRARGELSTHFGREHLASDLFMRRFHVHQRALQGLDELEAPMREVLETSALGMNLYIETHRGELPDWVQPVSASDLLAMNRAAVLRFAFDREGTIEQLKSGGTAPDPQAPRGAAVAVPSAGSNMWALAPQRTRSGHAILLGNPHLPWELTWYEGHLTIPGELNVYGASFLGDPYPLFGFNDHLGWTHTMNYPDLEDTYELELDPDSSDHFLLGGRSLPLRAVEVAVEVDGAEGRELERRTYWETELGPVIHRDHSTIWVIRSSVLDQLQFFEPWYWMGKARNREEFERGLARGKVAMFNVVYADRSGEILYRWLARLPIRPTGQDGRDRVRVSERDQIWRDIHPIADLPRLANPESGYVHNSNDPPWYTNLEQSIDPSRFPPYLPRPRLRPRSQLGLDLFVTDRKLSLEEVIALKHSPRMLLGERLGDELVAAVASAEDASPQLLGAARVLEAWDRTSASASRGGVLFWLWWEEYEGATRSPWRVAWDAGDPLGTPRGLGDPTAAVDALERAARRCEKRYGSVDVAWGEVHRVRLGELDLPISGCPSKLGCFRVINYRDDTDGRRIAHGGDSYVMAVEFSDPPRAWTVLPGGESGAPDSPHFADQIPLVSEQQLKRVRFTEADIAADLLASYRPGER